MIGSLPVQQQMVLIGIYSYFKKSDSVDASMDDLVTEVKWVCSSLSITYKKDLMNGLSELEQYNFISKRLSKGQTKYLLKLSFVEIETEFE